jgi:hypothetical protein
MPFKCLSLAQINDKMRGSQELPQGVDDETRKGRILIEDNLNNLPTRIQTEKATDMEDVTHHAQNAIVPQGCLPLAYRCDNDEKVRCTI